MVTFATRDLIYLFAEVLTGGFEAERDGRRLLPVLATLSLLCCDFDGIRINLVQTLTQDLVQTEKQIPVVVDKEERVHIVLGKQTNKRHINHYTINLYMYHTSF